MVKNLTDTSLYKKHDFPRKNLCAMIRCMYTAANDLTNNIIIVITSSRLNNLRNKKHCINNKKHIHDITKNKTFQLIQAFFEYNAFGTSLLFYLFSFWTS